MSTPKSLLGALVSKIAAEKTRLFSQIDKPRLTAIGTVILLTAVGGACLYGEAKLALKYLPALTSISATAEAPTNIGEAVASIDSSLGAYLEISETNNAILRHALETIASTASLDSKTIREMARATLGDIPGAQDRPLETAANAQAMSGASREKIRDLVGSGQITDTFETILKAISASKDASPDVLRTLAVSALKDAGDAVPTLTHLDLLGAIEKSNETKAVALHEIHNELKSLKGVTSPDYPQASIDLKDSALSGLYGESSADRIVVMALAKAEMAAGGEHSAEVTQAYNKSIALDGFFMEVIGKYLEGDIEPATVAELAEKTQAQLTAFESAEVSCPHKM